MQVVVESRKYGVPGIGAPSGGRTLTGEAETSKLFINNKTRDKTRDSYGQLYYLFQGPKRR